METSVTQLPFNRFLGLETAEPPAILRLPSGNHYLNHLGTVHASAQLALAEASSGEFLMRAMGPMDGVVAVVRRLEAKFRRPAKGALTSTVTSTPTVVSSARAELAAKGRAFTTVDVELRDESGACTLCASVEWFITLAQPQSSAEASNG